MSRIKINLLPKQATRAIKFTQKQWKLVASIVAGLMVISFVITGLVVFSQKSSYASQSADWDQKLASINSQIAGGEEVAQKAEGLSEQLDAIRELISKHTYWSKALKEIARLTPTNVQLTNFAGESTGKLNLSGITSDYKAAAAFAKSLETSQYFQNIELGSAGLTEQAGKFKVGFNITLELKGDALKWVSTSTSTTQTTQ